QLKRHLLDAIASLIQAQSSETVHKLVGYFNDLGTGGPCSVPVLGTLPIDRAAQWFTTLIRYPDFMDNYIGKEATCHPSDNIGPLLAAGQTMNLTGRDFLLAMALGYCIECRLVEEIPVMVKGFDHTVLYAYSVTAALSKVLNLTAGQTAHALGMAGSSFVPLVTSRASYTNEWKGIASSMVALGCVNTVLMAKRDVTGPLTIFEGPKGFEQVMEMKLKHPWTTSDFNLIRKCVLKSYNAEVHTQSSLEAAQELKSQFNINPSQIEEVEITTFLTAYHIVGGGAYGDRKTVYSKEQADHSLPYVMAVILLDGELYPGQLARALINRTDVQDLLKKIKVDTVSPFHKPLPFAGILDPYTDAYPDKLKTKVVITLKDGKKYTKEKSDYRGYYTRPFSWQDTVDKFNKLTGESIPAGTKNEIIAIINSFEKHLLGELISLLAH
ncbi:MAG: MmgE/PrpD family protein, partial [Bacteroidota bacterium]|nr:MmgE/PrpD family protein [Bacteroidota bacterium]